MGSEFEDSEELYISKNQNIWIITFDKEPNPEGCQKSNVCW
jgi:hypothetical protein